jgi:hypothetical protein
VEQHHGSLSLWHIPSFFIRCGTRDVFLLLFFFFSFSSTLTWSHRPLATRNCTQSGSDGHGRKKSLSDVTSLTGQSFFSTLSRMFCILFCYWVDHRRLLFPSVCRSTERPRRLLFRPQNCRISQSLSTVCVCVCFVCVWVCDGFGDTFQSISRRSFFLPSSSSGLRPFSFSLSEKDRVALLLLLLLVDSYMRHWTR